jgi:uncharacterized spore protein YtfJ
MADEIEMNDEMDAVGPYSSGDRVVDSLESTLDDFLGAATVEAVFAEPVEVGDHLVIPAAEIISVVGFGMGMGSGSSPSDDGENANFGDGAGGGGGGRTFARPVAVIVVSPEGVRVEPIIDITKLALAALTAAGFMATMIARMTRGPRDDD